MEIDLEEAFHGKTAEIKSKSRHLRSVPRHRRRAGHVGAPLQLCGGHGKVRANQGFFMVERICPTCNGRGEVIEKPCRSCRGEGRVDQKQKLEVSIPKGVDTGTRIRLTGKGEAGPFGSPPGDLYIFLHVKRHKVFERDATTLLTRAPISFTTAALGGSIEIPGLDGKMHEIERSGGHPVGQAIAQARGWHAGAERSRDWRSGGGSGGGNADQAFGPPEGVAARVSGQRDR
jgi:molecular chaperone DnaJ